MIMHNYNNVLTLNQHVAGSYGNTLSVTEAELRLIFLPLLLICLKQHLSTENSVYVLAPFPKTVLCKLRSKICMRILKNHHHQQQKHKQNKQKKI